MRGGMPTPNIWAERGYGLLVAVWQAVGRGSEYLGGAVVNGLGRSIGPPSHPLSYLTATAFMAPLSF